MKIIHKNNLELGDTLLPDQFILNYMGSLEGCDLKIYIYMLFCSKANINLEISDLCKKFNVTTQDVSFSLDRLQVEELITKTTEGYNIIDIKEVAVNKSYIPKMEPKKTKVQTEKEQKRIAAATAINESFFQGLMSLSWYTDIGAMFEQYSFAEEVMIALFHYCQERKALNKKYVYAVADTWFKGGVKTFEQLEDYLDKIDKFNKIKQKIAKSLRINRSFTKYEDQYIETWINDFKFDFDMIEEALKKTVNVANPSIIYINGILKNWNLKGYKKVQDIVEGKYSDKPKTEKKSKTTTKYQNYEQRDYDNLELYYDNI